MSWFAARLKNRLQIQQAVQTPSEEGGLDMTYTTIATIWCDVTELSDWSRAMRGANRMQGGMDDDEIVSTHQFKVRWSAVKLFGRQYGLGFGDGFDKIADLNPIKSDYFLFLEKGSSVKGMRFKARRFKRDPKNNEFFYIQAIEAEEAGTGFSI